MPRCLPRANLASRLWPAVLTRLHNTWFSSDQWFIKRNLLETFCKNNRSAWEKNKKQRPFYLSFYFLLIRLLNKDISGIEASILQQWGDKSQDENTTCWVWPERARKVPESLKVSWASELIQRAIYLHILFVTETSSCWFKPGCKQPLHCYLQPNSLLIDTTIKQKQPQLFFNELPV